MMEIHFEIDKELISLNKLLRMPYHKRHRYNEGWYSAVKAKVRGQIPPEPFTKYNVEFIRKFYRFLDFDGFVGSLKPVMDSLIHAKIIKDDTYKMSGPWTCLQEYHPKVYGHKLLVTITGE